MDGRAVVQSVIEEIVQPGVQRLMESRYFSELRAGKLSIERLQGWAIQHYLHNKAILKAFALGMVKNAHDSDLFNHFANQFSEEQSHPELAKRFGLALGLKEEDFAEATQIFECLIHTNRTIANTLLGTAAQNRASALTSEAWSAATPRNLIPTFARTMVWVMRCWNSSRFTWLRTRNTPRNQRILSPVKSKLPEMSGWRGKARSTWCASSWASSRGSTRPTLSAR
jgi:hypothetical protein